MSSFSRQRRRKKKHADFGTRLRRRWRLILNATTTTKYGEYYYEKWICEPNAACTTQKKKETSSAHNYTWAMRTGKCTQKGFKKRDNFGTYDFVYVCMERENVSKFVWGSTTGKQNKKKNTPTSCGNDATGEAVSPSNRCSHSRRVAPYELYPMRMLSAMFDSMTFIFVFLTIIT